MTEVGRQQAISISQGVLARWHRSLGVTRDDRTWRMYTSVGIQVSCSAENHSVIRDGRSPVSKYSRTSLYIAGHLPHLKAINQPFHNIYHTFQKRLERFWNDEDSVGMDYLETQIRTRQGWTVLSPLSRVRLLLRTR